MTLLVAEGVSDCHGRIHMVGRVFGFAKTAVRFFGKHAAVGFPKIAVTVATHSIGDVFRVCDRFAHCDL